VGCSLGSGVLIVLGESGCGLHESARVMDYLAAQSAGQCGPCTHGLRAVADGMAALAAGRRDGDRERVVRWASEIRGRGACHHPDGAVRFALSAVSVFAHEIEWHRHNRCTARAAGFPLGRTTVRQTAARSR
jgi:NADH:ubiquinone oxidoreductase subunit F (NADH-binding)